MPWPGLQGITPPSPTTLIDNLGVHFDSAYPFPPGPSMLHPSSSRDACHPALCEAYNRPIWRGVPVAGTPRILPAVRNVHKETDPQRLGRVRVAAGIHAMKAPSVWGDMRLRADQRGWCQVLSLGAKARGDLVVTRK